RRAPLRALPRFVLSVLALVARDPGSGLPVSGGRRELWARIPAGAGEPAGRNRDGSLRRRDARRGLDAATRRDRPGLPAPLPRAAAPHAGRLGVLLRLARRTRRPVSERGLFRLHRGRDGVLFQVPRRAGFRLGSPPGLVGLLVGGGVLAAVGAA